MLWYALAITITLGLLKLFEVLCISWWVVCAPLIAVGVYAVFVFVNAFVLWIWLKMNT